jgi:multiple sugar transport system permease protein
MTTTVVPRRVPRRSVLLQGYLRSVILYVFLLSITAVLLFPLVWLISTSLKDIAKEFSLPLRIVPEPIMWSNYLEVFRRAPFALFFRNSIMVTTLAVTGSVLSCSLVGFSFARLRYPGRDVLFGLVLSTMMLPAVMQLIPQFLVFNRIGWVNTFLPLIIPSWFCQANYGQGAFYIFLMRQFFRTIPIEYDEAARVDGASTLQIFWHVVLPLAVPPLTTVAIFAFLSNWSDYLYPLVFLQKANLQTVALGIRAFQSSGGGLDMVPWRLMSAASFLALIPPVIVLLIGQRYFVRGVTLSGLTGR